jgi:aminomethyltransferase
MKQTPFTAIHRSLGAKMAEFAGYEMPIEYTNITQEHLCVCHSVGAFDISHMGEFVFSGKNAYQLLQFLTSNDIDALSAGKAQYSCLMNEHGGVVDDLVIYCREPQNDYLAVVNAANIEKDFAHILCYAPRFAAKAGSDITDISPHIAQIAVQGPKAMALLQKFIAQPILQMPNYTFQQVDTIGSGSALFATTGYTGAGGGELYADVRQVDCKKLWYALMCKGQEFGIKPIGLGARDTLRLEMGYCLYGHELSDDTTPLEANLGWITKFNHDFLGMQALQEQKENGLSRKLVAFKMTERGVPRSGYALCSADGVDIGRVTSGTMSPLSRECIGMGYADIEHTAVGSAIYVRIRDKIVQAQVVKLPFRKM